MFSEMGSVGTATTSGMEREVALFPEVLLPRLLGAVSPWGTKVSTHLLPRARGQLAFPSQGSRQELPQEEEAARAGGRGAEERAFTLCLVSLTTGIEALRRPRQERSGHLMKIVSREGWGPGEIEGAPVGPEAAQSRATSSTGDFSCFS